VLAAKMIQGMRN